MFSPLSTAPQVKYLYLVGTCIFALCLPFLSLAQPNRGCVINDNFSDLSLYTINAKFDCDSNPGIFDYATNNRFTINDMEGLTCGASDNQIIFNNIDISNFTDLIITLRYTVVDSGDGFECASVFGNGNDQLSLSYMVGTRQKGPINIFCEDTGPGITSSRKAQFSIPDGTNLNFTIFAGTQAPSEIIYLDNIKVCGTMITEPVVPPPPPDETVGPFQPEISNIQCRTSSIDILPEINTLYPDHPGGTWYDGDGLEITEIIPSTLSAGLHLFRYVLTDGNVSEFSLTVIDDELQSPILGPYCRSNDIVDLPQVVNGYDVEWQGDGITGVSGLRLSDLDLGDDNDVSITFRGSGCGIDYKVDIIESFLDIETTSCPPGIVNLADSIPNLTALVEELDFREFITNDPISDPENVNMADYPGPLTTFVHALPDGCKNNDEVAIVIDTSCPSDAPPTATISIDPSDGNICEGDCGEVTVNISGGVGPYSLEFDATMIIQGSQVNVSVPADVSGSAYTASICSDPSISFADLLSATIDLALGNDENIINLIYDSATNSWSIPTVITTQGQLSGWVIDADGTRVRFENDIDIQAFEKPDFPIDASDILVCADDVSSFDDLSSVANFNEIIFYDGDPTASGTEVTDFSSVDLLDLYGIWTNPDGCVSDPTRVEYTINTNDAQCNPTTTCTTPPTPVLVEGTTNQEWCDDGSFPGFRVQADGPFATYQFDWYDANTNARIQQGNVSFDPGADVEGDFYVTAVDPNDATCRSNPLNFSFSYLRPSVDIENCDVVDGGVVVDISLRSDERIFSVNPNTTFTRLTGDTWRLLNAQANTDYEIIIESSTATDRCRMTYTLDADDYTCTETCSTAGDPVTEFVEVVNTTVDLESLLINNEGPIGIFIDEDGNEVSSPYTFTEDVVLYHFVEMSGTCEESRAEIRLRLVGGSIDGNVCVDNIFCDEIRIVLSSGRGSGAPYTMRFEMFDATVIQEIVFEQEDLFNDSTLMVTVCVSGTENIYNQTSKTLFIAEGTPAGTIVVTELRDSNGDLLGAVPPIDVDFSPLPVVTTINDIVDVCMFESTAFPIRDLNDQILTNSDDVLEWWYEQPSDPTTIDSDKVLGDAAVNPGDIIYALVISPDDCKVEVPVTFNLVEDDAVDVAYEQFYCVGDVVEPTTLDDNGLSIDFNFSPKNGSSRIIRATGEIIDPVIGTEYTVSWITTGICPVSDSTKVTVLPAGDARCNCPTIDPPIIGATNIPPQPPLEGDGISFCFDDPRPPLVITNNPGNLTAIWYTSRALTNEVHRGNEYLDADNQVNYYVLFEDADGCASELTPIFTFRNPGQRLNSRNISICANDESSIDLTSFLVRAEGFTVDWFDPLGNPIADPTNYSGAGVTRNELLTMRQEYVDPDGCGDNTQVQFTITDYDALVFDKFVCNAAENFYSLEFEAPSHFNVTSDVGKVSESGGVFLIDSVDIGSAINLDITDNFLNCPFQTTITSPSCNCDALPDPRTVNRVDTICFGDQFEIFNSNGDYIINWYDVPTGGISISNSEIFEGIVVGTFYAEIIDRVSSCVSERKPFVVLDFVSSPLRGDLNTLDLVTCIAQPEDRFTLTHSEADYTVVWLDANTREVIAEGDSFRPDETQFPPGVDHNFIVAYRTAFGCISTVGQSLTYRIYPRPRLIPIDTTCSEDLKSVTFEFRTGTADEVTQPMDVPMNARGNFELVEAPIGQDIEFVISRARTSTICAYSTTVNFDPTNTCPCPDIPAPDPLGPSAETICANTTDFEFRLNRFSIPDVVASWYDNPDGIGEPLLRDGLDFTPPDSGAYYVLLVDTITSCTSPVVQLNLFYDDVPSAGEGMMDVVCGSDSILLADYLIAPFEEGGEWTDADGNVLAPKISALNYATEVPLSFFYTVTTTNVVPCSDVAEVVLTLQTPFNAGVGRNLDAICDQAQEEIDFEAIIGSHDDGMWLDNDATGIDLNVTPIISSSDLPPGEYVYTFVVAADLVCGTERSDVRVVILPLPDVGMDTRDTICAGEEFGYNFATALDGDTDPLGVWEDVDSRLTTDINTNPGSVDLNGLRPGDYVFRFSHTTGGCSADSDLLLHVRESNFAGVDTLVQICNDGDLSLNFERVLPGANGYELSIEGGASLDFSQPGNVDVSGLSSGSYTIRNVANAIPSCNVDEAVVTLVIEASKIAPPLDDNYQVCFGDTVDLSMLVAAGGVFEEINVVGAIVNDTLFTDRIGPDIPFAVTYVIPPDSVCAPQPEAFTITALMSPNAGDDVTEVVCQGDSIDLESILPTNADLGGVFVDIEGTGQLTGSILQTETLDESTFSFSYEVGDGSVCPIDLSIINIDIREVPMLSDSTHFPICETNMTSYDLTAHVGSDLTGEYLNPNNVAIDLSDPSAVDLSSLDFATTYTLGYTLTNGMCADTVILTFEIDEQYYAGQDGVFIGHCQGDPVIINLSDQLIDEDPGVWYDAAGAQIADPDNFDLGLLAADSYTLKHVVRDTRGGLCMDDSVTIQILVEPAPNAGGPQSVTQCQNVTYDLRELLDPSIDPSGTFEDRDGHANLVGSMIDIGGSMVGDYEYYYVLETNASCPPDVAVFTITVVPSITAGEANGDLICQGDEFDLTSLLVNADAGGRFENADTQTPYTDTNLDTETLAGVQNIWYIVESGNCEPDTASLTLDVRVTPDLGSDIDFVVCQSDAATVNFLNELGTRDQSGRWLDPLSTGIDFTDPAAVDLSGMTPLIPDTVSYTLDNGNCADTIDVIFTLDKALFAGQAGVTDIHCEGRPRVIDLNDYFTDADQGQWSVNGEPIDDATAFDLSGLEDGSYTFLHAVTNVELGVCPDPPAQTLELTVFASSSAGVDVEQTLCQNIDFDLMTILGSTADAGGVFIDGDENVIGSEITTTGVPEDVYEYQYIVQGNANCDADTASITITVVSEIDAGEQNGDEVCQGTDFDLTTLIINGDPGGRFEEVSTGRVIVNPVLSTDALLGELDFRYIVESPSCEADTAAYILTVYPTYNDITEYKIAEGDSVLIGDIWYKEAQTIEFDGLSSQGCDSVVTSIITVTDFSVDPIDVSCAGTEDGGFTISVNAGVLNFNYQITQITGGTNSIGGFVSRYGDSDIMDFSEGEYAIFITDGNMEVVFDDTLAIGIDRLIVPTITSLPTSCFGFEDGSLVIESILLDGAPQNLDAYTYVWSTGDVTSTVDNVGGGFHTVVITDTLTMCPYEFEYFVDEPEALMVDTMITDFQCGGTMGAIELDILSNVDDLPEFSLDGGPVQGVGLFSDLDPGYYQVTIAYGECSQVFDSLQVRQASENTIEIEPNDINLVEGQEEQINVLPSFDVIDVEWSSYEGLDTTDILNPIVTGIDSMEYIVTLTDGFGCTFMDTLIVNVLEWQDPIPDLYIPNIFNPADPGVNKTFRPFTENSYPGTYTLQIFNRWGNTVHMGVHDAEDESTGWDGTHNGMRVQMGVYTYMIRFNYENGTRFKRYGDLTVKY